MMKMAGNSHKYHRVSNTATFDREWRLFHCDSVRIWWSGWYVIVTLLSRHIQTVERWYKSEAEQKYFKCEWTNGNEFCFSASWCSG